MPTAPLRIAVALSGGVDSSVTALFLRRCVQTRRDLHALWRTSTSAAAPPDYSALLHAVLHGTPWSAVAAPAGREPPCGAAPRGGGSGEEEEGTRVELFPFFMHNWHDMDAAHGWCAAAQQDYDDAQSVAHALDLVPRDRRLAVVDLSAAFADRCFEPMLAAYTRGATLNIDVLCNREIKFGALVEHHLGWQLGEATTCAPRSSRTFSPLHSHPCELLATGHYARTVRVAKEREGAVVLARPRSAAQDLNDQTLFLAQVRPQLWPRVVLPLGHVFAAKADVRRLCAALADDAAGPDADVWRRVARKRTSTGICFVGVSAAHRRGCSVATARQQQQQQRSCSGSFAAFLHDYVPPPEEQPPLSPTRFLEVVDSDKGGAAPQLREIPAERFHWKEHAIGLDDTPARTDRQRRPFPAYAFTVGQRLRCFTAGGPRDLYVLAKELQPAPPPRHGRTAAHRSIQALHLVARWDHPLFYTRRTFSLAHVVWHLEVDTLHALHRRQQPRRPAGGASLWCLGCTRHLEALRPCWLSLPPLPLSSATSCPTVRVSVDTSDGAAEPFRALASGQLFVAYLPLGAVRAVAAAAGGMEPRDEQVDDEDDCLVVVASGWVETEGEADARAHLPPPQQQQICSMGPGGRTDAPTRVALVSTRCAGS